MRITIGTRGSPLALAQAGWFGRRLAQSDPQVDVRFQIIRTHGDEGAGRGGLRSGKAIFTQRIEDALRGEDIDAAVHSYKDLATDPTPGLVVGAVPQREDPREAFVGRSSLTLEGLRPGAVVGTSSLRRSAQLLSLRPDLEIRALSGNVETRLRKLDQEGWDAILLAYAGLRRLDLGTSATQVLEVDRVLPAPAQGALAVQVRADDAEISRRVRATDDGAARLCTDAERELARRLGADCNAPVGTLATVEGGRLTLRACVADAQGKTVLRRQMAGPADDPHGLAQRLAASLLGAGAGRLLEGLAA